MNIIKKSSFIFYVINGKIYKMVTSPSRGPVPIVQIINENNWFIADLNCGANLIPSIYFDGNFVKLAN